MAQAKALTVGVAQTHHMCQDGDVDWVAIPLQANVTYRIETNNLAFGVDTRITLYDGTTVLANDDDGGDQLFSSVITVTPASTGTYYLRVDLAQMAEPDPQGQTYVVLASVK